MSSVDCDGLVKMVEPITDIRAIKTRIRVSGFPPRGRELRQSRFDSGQELRSNS